MGSIIKPICSCRAPFKELYLGGGMMNFMTVCNVPGVCMSCGTITETNILDEHHRCKKCRNEMTLVGKLISFEETSASPHTSTRFVFDWNVSLDGKYLLENKLYTCPICKEETLKFEDQGCWD